MTKIRILINGAAGKMGQEAVKAIQSTDDLLLVAQTGRSDDLAAVIASSQAQVVVDLTTAESAFVNASKIIAANAHPVIGTSGLQENQVHELAKLAAAKSLGGIVVPNFSIGAVLAMRYAEDCARYFPAVEILEMHHAKKADAPSGTAIRTAERMAQVKSKLPANPAEKEILPGARGAHYQDIAIHSVRLPGLLAHQVVMFGGAGENLSIRHDVSSREAYMPGLCLACRKVMGLSELVYGLEHVL